MHKVVCTYPGNDHQVYSILKYNMLVAVGTFVAGGISRTVIDKDLADQEQRNIHPLEKEQGGDGVLDAKGPFDLPLGQVIAGRVGEVDRPAVRGREEDLDAIHNGVGGHCETRDGRRGEGVVKVWPQSGR